MTKEVADQIFGCGAELISTIHEMLGSHAPTHVRARRMKLAKSRTKELVILWAVCVDHVDGLKSYNDGLSRLSIAMLEAERQADVLSGQTYLFEQGLDEPMKLA